LKKNGWSQQSTAIGSLVRPGEVLQGAFDISNSASVYSVPEGPVVIAPLRAFTCAPKMILPVQFANELSGATLKSTIPL